MSYHSVKGQANLHRELKRRLLESDPDLDEATLLDTLDGATSLKEAIALLVRSALEDEALMAGLKLRMNDLTERMERFRHRVIRKRQTALEAMQSSGVLRIEACDLTVSVRSGQPKLAVTSADDIPEWFFIPQKPRLDRRALLAALKAGTAIAGAELSNGEPSLSVRTR